MVCDFGGRFDFWDDSDGFFFLREKKRKTGLRASGIEMGLGGHCGVDVSGLEDPPFVNKK